MRTNVDCVEVGAYGTDDTITIPGGRVLLAADLPQITESVTIQGAGMGQTTIDGDGQWGMINALLPSSNDTITLTGLKLTGFHGISVTATGGGSTRLSYLDIDGSRAINDGNVSGGILVAMADTEISEVHIHDLRGDGIANGLFGVNIHVIGGLASRASVSNVTVDNISSADSGVTAFSVNNGLLDGSLTPGISNVLMNNVTIADLDAGTNTVVGVAGAGAVSGGDSTINIEMNNTTVSGLLGANSGGILGRSTAVLLGGAALGGGDTMTASFSSTNNIFSGGIPGCTLISDIAPVLGAGVSAGNVVNAISSKGGNLVSDATCSPYFTQSTDQNNLGNLASSLGILSDNGGFVPTVALLEGSPAIDSGVIVAGLTQDARLAARPQGSAFDSGAYESPFTKVSSQSPSEASLASTGASTLRVELLGAALSVLASVGILDWLKTKKIYGGSQ